MISDDTRLARRRRRQVKFQILVILLGISLFIFGVVRFGFPFLFDLTETVIKFRHGETGSSPASDASLEIPAEPRLEPAYVATNSALVQIVGYSDPKTIVSVFLNSRPLADYESDQEGRFAFDIELEPGINRLLAQATNNRGRKSAKSYPVEIFYYHQVPDLIIDSPADGQRFSQNQTTIKGKTASTNSLTVNNRKVILNSDGTFSWLVVLVEGENKIAVTVLDPGGNKAEKVLTLRFNR